MLSRIGFTFRRLSLDLAKGVNRPRPALTMDTIFSNRRHLSSLPYTHCQTRIVSLLDLDLPEQASDDDYRRVYQEYTAQTQGPHDNAALLRDAVESIKHGIAPPVAFPTETVYGLGADATNEPAVSGIFAAKGRPSDNPLIVHVSSVAHLERLTGEPLPEIYRSLAQRFWPGPLTILLGVPKDSVFAKNVHPAQSTIGFRVPSSKYARFFIAATDRPIAGPSANSSGKPSPTTARHVLDDLHGKTNFILDGGPCDVGVESTVVDGLHDPPLILRPGGVSQSELVAHGKAVGNRFASTAIGYKRHDNNTTTSSSRSASPSTPSVDLPPHSASVNYEEDVNGAPRAPGMKYRHYSPEGRLILFSVSAISAGKVRSTLDELVRQSPPTIDGKVLKIGFISCRWPAFAGLPVTPAAKTDAAAQEPFQNSVYAPVTSIATYTDTDNNSSTQSQVLLYNIHVGPEITSLAHSLFGILRLFDDLGCSYILAETVARNNSHPVSTGTTSDTEQQTQIRDIEDAVIDRIEKAAAERVD